MLICLLVAFLFLARPFECVHSNNWAVIVDTSRFWFNYRHAGNALAFYRSIKRLGIPDSQIILMLTDDVACDLRNPIPGHVHYDPVSRLNLYGEEIEVDYRGYEVTPENLMRVLTGRVFPTAPASKRLNTDEFSNILVYLTGHGGEDFIKFQDNSEISSQDLADAFAQMHAMKRYNEILFVADTCQAASLASKIYSPNIISVTSSKTGQDSYSNAMDSDIGVYVSDRFSSAAYEFLNTITAKRIVPITRFFDVCPPHICISHVTHTMHNFTRPLKMVTVNDFFTSIRPTKSLSDFGWPEVQLTADQQERHSAPVSDRIIEESPAAYSYMPQLSLFSSHQ